MIFRTHRVVPSAVFAMIPAITLLATSAVQAQTFDAQVSGQVNFGAPPPVYTQPQQPVYVQQQPVYAQPQPVYVQPQPVYVQPQQQTVLVQPQPGYVRRSWYAHDGFFFRGAIGIGYSVFSGSSGSGTVSLSGVSLNGDVALGFAATPSLALHLSLDYAGIFAPSVSAMAGGVTTSGIDTSGATYNLGIIGVGSTYWVTNFFMSGSIGAAYMSADQTSSYPCGTTVSTTVGQSNVGVGLNLMAGWDFPLSPWWALGVSGQFMYARMPDSDGVTTWNDLSGAILLQFSNY